MMLNYLDNLVLDNESLRNKVSELESVIRLKDFHLEECRKQIKGKNTINEKRITRLILALARCENKLTVAECRLIIAKDQLNSSKNELKVCETLMQISTYLMMQASNTIQQLSDEIKRLK